MASFVYSAAIEPVRDYQDSPRPGWSRVRDRNGRRTLDVARSLVEEQGLEQLSMRRLADRAGISVRTLYNLFGDKDGLLTALVQHSLDAIGMAQLEISATDPIEQIWEAVTITIDTTVESVPKSVLATVLADDYLYGRLVLRWQGRSITIGAIQAATSTGALCDDVPGELLIDHAGMVHRHLLRRWAGGEIDEDQLRAGVLHAYDVALLAVARPATRARLLAHAATLAPRLAPSGPDET